MLGREPGEKLSDQEIGNLLAGVGNSEAKAITFLAMSNGRIFSRTDLRRAVMRAQGKTPGWRLDSSSFIQYCADSFEPIGLVAREVLNPDLSTFGYVATNYGKELGIPLAGHLLDISLKYRPTLYQFFGSTVNSNPLSEVKNVGDIEYKNRSPLLRFRLYRRLLSSGELPIRESDLLQATGYNRNKIGPHLQSLSETGIIEYDSASADAPVVYYKLSDDPPPDPPPSYRIRRTVAKTLTLGTYQLIKDNAQTEFSINDTKKAMGQGNHTLMSSVLAHLRRKGYIDAVKYDGMVMSVINLTTEQRMALSDLLHRIRSIQMLDPQSIHIGESLAQSIMTNPNVVSRLMEKAKSTSSRSNAIPPEEAIERIVSIVSEKPGITTREIKEHLRGSGISMKEHTINEYLKEAKNLQVLDSVRAGTRNIWHPKRLT